ncbi:protein IWS1 homolog [Poecilia latipinna]|uniref:protein IWS1 homolog n=1 Tax=Poecilia latipinna TaxID=48699 RepID=UPI00072E165A|nr:PREDICTED: protein IWS1 homolog [Poecilia latipinna]
MAEKNYLRLKAAENIHREKPSDSKTEEEPRHSVEDTALTTEHLPISDITDSAAGPQDEETELQHAEQTSEADEQSGIDKDHELTEAEPSQTIGLESEVDDNLLHLSLVQVDSDLPADETSDVSEEEQSSALWTDQEYKDGAFEEQETVGSEESEQLQSLLHLTLQVDSSALEPGETKATLKDDISQEDTYSAEETETISTQLEEFAVELPANQYEIHPDNQQEAKDEAQSEREITETQGEGEITETQGEGEITETQGEGEITETQGEGEITETQGEGEITETQGEGEITETEGEGEITEIQSEREITETEGEGEITEIQGEKEITETQSEKEVTETQTEGGVTRVKFVITLQIKQSRGEREITETQGEKEITETQEKEITETQEKEITETQGEKEITETQEKEITETRGEREITETQKETEITETQENERTETQKETEITETQENERTETQKETERTETQKEKEVTETPSGGEITETQKEKEITETQKEKEITETEVSLEKTGGSPSVSEKSFDSVKEGKQVTFKDEDEIFTPEFDFEFEETDYEESPSDSSDGTPADSKEEKGPAER